MQKFRRWFKDSSEFEFTQYKFGVSDFFERSL